jgi:hypothetical protein
MFVYFHLTRLRFVCKLRAKRLHRIDTWPADPSSKNRFWLEPNAYGHVLTAVSCTFFGLLPDDLARRLLERARPAEIGPQGRLEVERGSLCDGVGGGDSDDVSDVPSSEERLPRSVNLGPAGDGDSFLKRIL